VVGEEMGEEVGEERVKRTVNAIDAYDIFQDGGALIWGLPVQQDAIGLDAGKRNEGRDGDLETQ
jgi:hypothetical protein